MLQETLIGNVKRNLSSNGEIGKLVVKI